MRLATIKGALLASAAGMTALWSTGAMAQQAPQDGDAPQQQQSGEIVVVGTRAEAVDLQLRSDKSISALSEEDLQHTAVHNVAEALGLMPSVNVMNTGSSFFGGVDGASRGEGMFVSIRGLNAEFNVNLINGVNVAQGMPYSRQVQLSLLPPSGLNTIILSKESTADMDGDAIGGTVDFRTPNAFDYTDDFRLGVTASGRIETRARDYGDKGLGGGFAGELATRFGADKSLGLYVSGYYDERHYANSEVAGIMSAKNDGGWGYLVEDAEGNSYPGVNPEDNIAQTGLNVGVSNGYTWRWGGNASIDWHPDDTLQIYLRGTYAYAKTQQNSTLSQFTNTGKSYDELVPGSGRYGLSVDAISTRTWYETNPETATLATAAFGGTKQAGSLKISPQLFYSEGHNNRPNHIETSVRIDQGDKFNHGTARPFGGLSIGYRDGLPYPLFTDETYADLDNASSRLLARRAGQLTAQFSGQRKWGGRLDMEIEGGEGSLLRSIKFGGKYSDSHRDVTNRDWTNDHFANLLGQGGATWDSLGIATGSYDAVFPGVYEWSIPKVDQQKIFDYFYKYKNDASFDSCGSLYVNNLNCNTMRGSEAVSAAYASAELQSGDVQIIPGVRYEHTSIHDTYWVLPNDEDGEQPGYWESNKTSYDELLPSLFVNYRPDSKSVYRGSLWWSYTRPAFFQLAGGSRYSVSDSGVTITKGNPDLKPIRAINADVSGEWQFAPGGYAMLGGFYKHLSNYIYDNAGGYANSATYSEDNVHTSMPQNGGDGDVYGIEVQLRKKLTELPGLLSGFGVGANFTQQWSKVDIGDGLKKRIQNAPEYLADAQLFYEYKGFSFDLIYHYAGEYVSEYNSIGQPGEWDDTWVRPLHSFDLHAGYDAGHGMKFDLSVANLFGDYSYWAHIGKNSTAISDVVDSGSTVLLTAKFGF